MNISEIKELAQIMQESNLSCIEIDGDKVVIKREVNNIVTQQQIIADKAVVSNDTKVENTTTKTEGKIITAPTVGVYYASPSPDSDAYVKVGDSVKNGDILCIIEAMKLMNEIQADCDGEIAEIMVNNGDVVEYGQALFRIV